MKSYEEDATEILEYRVDPSQNGDRLDCFIAEKTPEWVSRTMVQKAIEQGRISVNETVKKPSYRVKLNDRILIEIPAPPVLTVLPEEIALDILYEDTDIIVINKPAKMMVHPLPSNTAGTLVNALLFRFGNLPQTKGSLNRPGIVHRLDKETSGVMVVAKSAMALYSLSKQFRERKNRKEYFALLHGIPQKKNGTIDLAISRHPKSRLKMVVDPSGKEAFTDYRVISEYKNRVSLVHVRIKTGRTHQIRVHFKYLNTPVLGDYLYGYLEEDKMYGLDRQMLHAARLGFFHPDDNRWVSFVAPLPEDFKNVLRALSI
jgi:23S rRNA pseudouridine1911/1915/1917 synthase